MSRSQFDPLRTRFMAKMANPKLFTSILKALQFVDVATIQVSDLGIRVMVDDSHTLQSSVYIRKNDAIFTEYHFLGSDSVQQDETDHSTFSINLKILIEHLNMFFEVESTLQIIYKGQGAPFSLVFHYEDEHVTGVCDIKTRNVDNFLEIDFDDENVPCSIKFRGQDFYRLIDDLHRATPQGEQIEFTIQPNTPNFQIRALGAVDIKTTYALDKLCDMVTFFKAQEKLVFRYRWSHLKLLLKTLVLASSCTVAMDKNGILCIKSVVSDDQQCQVMVEYLLIAIVDDDDRW